ncbi:hypothetical protein GCM10025859_07130 [Alicyclobacillus fastidiosus]|nr:hypothetical protein GCM10025859_07130 [Alicyclobacillus fastidiosus]
MGLASVRFKLLMGLSSTAVIGLSLSTVYAETVQYTVRSGDSLWAIASKYHTTVSSIESVNGLKSDVLHPGQHLVVNTTTSTSDTKTVAATTSKTASSSSSSYTVKSGDTLWSISQRYGVSLSSLEAWNHLTSSSILHVGQRLVIKGGSATLGSRSGSPAADLTDALGYQVAQYAEQFTGVPYAWGGTSPSGFDCSGFVQYVYAHFGTLLPRTSYSQYGTGTSVSESSLLPGDIVFFDTYGSGASHDGIYVGNGQFINAASVKVEIDSLSSDYWASHYIGARRL